MEHRIVQVGSRYMLAGFEDGRYYVRSGDASHQPPLDTSTSRNPRLLLDVVASEDLFDSTAEAEAAYRETHAGEPIWDYNESAAPVHDFMSLRRRHARWAWTQRPCATRFTTAACPASRSAATG